MYTVHADDFSFTYSVYTDNLLSAYGVHAVKKVSAYLLYTDKTNLDFFSSYSHIV